MRFRELGTVLNTGKEFETLKNCNHEKTHTYYITQFTSNVPEVIITPLIFFRINSFALPYMVIIIVITIICCRLLVLCAYT